MSEKGYGKTVEAIVKGTALGIPVCFAALLAASFLLAGMNVGEKAFGIAALLCRAVGGLTAGFFAAALSKERGLLCGGGAGALMGTVMLPVGILCYGGITAWSDVLIGWLVGFLLAAVGGILGVNLRKY